MSAPVGPPVLRHYVAALADHLPGWVVAGSNERPELIGQRGARVRFRYRIDVEGVVSVWGGWPSDGTRTITPRDVGAPAPALCFGVHRSPGAVARDIRRRFLGAYLPLYGLCLEALAASGGSRDEE